MITCGIDIGSRTSKIVLYDSDSDKPLASLIEDSSYNQKELAGSILDKALEDSGLAQSNIAYTIATGYGRNLVETADETVTEITCHARGARMVFPEASAIIDIGGQDSKIIFVNGDGLVRDFMINDRCAAGTGRFLEVAARILDVELSQMGEVSKDPDQHVDISGMCVVFAESEIIGLISKGVSRSSILNAVERSITKRLLSMAGRGQSGPQVVFTGGVAMNSGMVRTLQTEIDRKLLIPPVPQITGALGAAIIAVERRRKKK